jgi:hypothetical protein
MGILRTFISKPLALMVLVQMAVNTEALAEGFRVEGTLTCVASGLIPPKTQQTGFDVAVDGNRWQIKTLFDNGSYYLHSCDGTNIYCIFEELPHPVTIGLNKFSMDSSTLPIPGVITDGTFPTDAEYYTILPWLAFASANHIESSSNSMPGFWLNSRAMFVSWLCKAEVSNAMTMPHIPLQVRYVTTKETLETAQKNPNLGVEGVWPDELKARSSQFRSQFTPGIMGGVYSVTATTNFHEMTLPVKFYAVQYDMFRKGKVGTTNVLYRGEVTNITAVSKGQFLPEIDGGKTVSVIDHRFRKPGYKLDFIQYATTNSWPSDTDPRLLAIYTKKLDSIPRLGLETVKRGLIYLVFALLALVPICVPLGRWMRKKQKPKNERQDNNEKN